MASPKTLRTCKKGHQFYKSTDCPTCPICEKEKKPTTGFLSHLSSPARNALLRVGIDSVQTLATFTEKEILALHGVGKASLPVFYRALAAEGRSFKPETSKPSQKI